MFGSDARTRFVRQSIFLFLAAAAVALTLPLGASAPQLQQAIVYGRSGLQLGLGVAATSDAVYVLGMDLPGSGEGTSFVLSYASPGGMLEWAKTSPPQSWYESIAVSGSTIYLAGMAGAGVCSEPPVECEQSPVKARPSQARMTTAGVWLGCGNEYFFPYCGQDSFYAVATDGEGNYFAGGTSYQYRDGVGNLSVPFVLAKYGSEGSKAAAISEPCVELGTTQTPAGWRTSSVRAVTIFDGFLYAAGTSSLEGVLGECAEGERFDVPMLMKYDLDLSSRVWKQRPAPPASLETYYGVFNGVTEMGGFIYTAGYQGMIPGGWAMTPDFLVAKFATDGTLQWKRSWVGMENEELVSIVGTGGRLFAAGHISGMGSDIVVLEIDPETGNILNTIVWEESGYARAAGIAANGDGLFVVGTIDDDVVLLHYTLNTVPVADDKSVTTKEDVPLDIVLTATDEDPAALTWSIVDSPAHGALTGTAPNLTYDPDDNWSGSDSFTFKVNDGEADSNTATVSITVSTVNDVPVIDSVSLATQNVHYSDEMVHVTIAAHDVDSTLLDIGATAALPDDLAFGSETCETTDGVTSCTWELSGKVRIAAQTRHIDITVSDDGEATSDSARTTLVVEKESARATASTLNPVSLQVPSPGGVSPLFVLAAGIRETTPDTGPHDTWPGDIGLPVVTATLTPVGPGPSVNTSCTAQNDPAAYDYAGVLNVNCTFGGLPVNTYTVTWTVGGDYYTGSGEDVLVVYDPSLGFASGGGWFISPAGFRTSFGFTMKYTRKGSGFQGNLLMISHAPDGGFYRVRSNALYGLSLGEDAGVPLGWASFAGKATYLEPGWPEALGGYEFTVYAEDRNNPGSGTDRFWVQLSDHNGALLPVFSMPVAAGKNAVPISGGNIIIPHKGAKSR